MIMITTTMMMTLKTHMITVGGFGDNIQSHFEKTTCTFKVLKANLTKLAKLLLFCGGKLNQNLFCPNANELNGTFVEGET